MNLFISNFKKWPGSLVGGLVIFLGIQFTIANSASFWQACYPFAGHDNTRFEAVLKTLPKDDLRDKVFIIGSSQAREGFDVEHMNNIYGEESAVFYNLGCSAGAAPIDVFMVKNRLFESNPKVIVYVLHPGSFYQDYVYEKMKYYFDPIIIPYIYKYFGVVEIFKHAGYFLDSFIGSFFDLYKYREGFSEIIFKVVSATIKGEYPEKPHFFTQESQPKSYFEEQIKKANMEKFKETKYITLNQNLFNLFTKEAKNKGIEVIVVSGPTHPLTKMCYSREIDEMYDTFLVDESNKVGFTYLSQEDLPEFREDDFVDFMHLNKQGRNRLSKYIGDYLEEERLIR